MSFQVENGFTKTWKIRTFSFSIKRFLEGEKKAAPPPTLPCREPVYNSVRRVTPRANYPYLEASATGNGIFSVFVYISWSIRIVAGHVLWGSSLACPVKTCLELRLIQYGDISCGFCLTDPNWIELSCNRTSFGNSPPRHDAKQGSNCWETHGGWNDQ